MITADDHKKRWKCRNAGKMMAYNENDVISNPNRQGASTYSIRIDMAEEKPDVSSNHRVSDNEDTNMVDNEPDVTRNMTKQQVNDEDTNMVDK